MDKKRWAFASAKILPRVTSEIEKRVELLRLETLPSVYTAIQQHADIQLMIIENRIFIDEDAYTLLYRNQVHRNQLEEMEKRHGSLVRLKGRLGSQYPKTVAFNGKYCEGTFVHHLSYSAPEIIDFCIECGIKRIHVQQGYTGCSLFMLTSKHAITSDLGIEKVLKENDIRVLKIEEGNILLEGLSHGFIGGCMGVLEKEVFVNGNLYAHPNGCDIIEFIQKQGYEIIMDETSRDLVDIGSILFY